MVERQLFKIKINNKSGKTITVLKLRIFVYFKDFKVSLLNMSSESLKSLRSMKSITYQRPNENFKRPFKHQG